MPPEVQEFRRKFREWDVSFQSWAKRMAYIRKLCKRIAEVYHPEKIILFGSHAYGKPTPETEVESYLQIEKKLRQDFDNVLVVDQSVNLKMKRAEQLATAEKCDER